MSDSKSNNSSDVRELRELLHAMAKTCGIREAPMISAREISLATGLPLPEVLKAMKSLEKRQLLRQSGGEDDGVPYCRLRIDGAGDAIVGKRLTYARLIAKVPA